MLVSERARDTRRAHPRGRPMRAGKKEARPMYVDAKAGEEGTARARRQCLIRSPASAPALSLP